MIKTITKGNKLPHKEIKLYLDKAKDRIYSAQILLKAGQYNDAISRVYYAFFDAATAALLTKNLRVKTHQGLIILFNKHFVKNNKMPVKIARYLTKAFEARQEADYEALKKFDKEDVKAAIKSAKEFVKKVEEIISYE